MSPTESVCELPYLGSVVDAPGRMDLDIDRRIAQASKAFGALHKSVFSDKDQLVQAKQKINQLSCLYSMGQSAGPSLVTKSES